jgi:hypothetical protein
MVYKIKLCYCKLAAGKGSYFCKPRNPHKNGLQILQNMPIVTRTSSFVHGKFTLPSQNFKTKCSFLPK